MTAFVNRLKEKNGKCFMSDLLIILLLFRIHCHYVNIRRGGGYDVLHMNGERVS